MFCASPSVAAPPAVRFHGLDTSSCSALRKPYELVGWPAGVADGVRYIVNEPANGAASCPSIVLTNPGGRTWFRVRNVFLRIG